MSDDLTISAGGAIAVDTAELDAVATVLDGCAASLSAAAADVRSAELRTQDVPTAIVVGGGGLVGIAGTLVRLAEEATATAAALRAASAAYALVELRVARQAALSAGDAETVARIDAEIAAIENAHPGSTDRAASLLHDYRLDLGALFGLVHLQAVSGGPLGVALGVLLLGSAVGIRMLGHGAVAAGSSAPRGGRPGILTGAPVPAAVTAPRLLADAARRIPAGSAQVRVERYERPGGARVFAVYIAGTRALAGSDPWDMTSNIEAYSGQGSDSLATVRAALVDAGARPGDELLAFGHSQGGMLAGQLALDDTYDTTLVGTFGSPTAVDVGDGTLSVQLRHADDPVAALADGGHPQRVGADGSFVAGREVHAIGGVLQDATFSAHHMDQYVETAQLVDESSDPRAAALRDRLAGLADARALGAVEYRAERPPEGPRPTPAPSPGPAPTAPGGQSRR